MPSITIIGPGAIGGAVAAFLSQDAANKITICARTPFRELVVETPNGTLIALPEIHISPHRTQPVDWVLVATKTYDVKSTADWFPNLVAPNTRIAILQNGVEHVERFAPYLPVASIVPVIVNLPAERKAPGRIWQRGDGHFFVSDDDNGRDFAGLFSNTRLTTTPTTDLRTQAWRKLALNCTGAVPALLLKCIDLDRNAEMIDVFRSLVRECVLVGRAEGALLDDTLEDEIIAVHRNSPANSINSLHADRLAGRPMEIDARNGAVDRIGQKHGIDAPMNRLMVTLLKAGTAI